MNTMQERAAQDPHREPQTNQRRNVGWPLAGFLILFGIGSLAAAPQPTPREAPKPAADKRAAPKRAAPRRAAPKAKAAPRRVAPRPATKPTKLPSLLKRPKKHPAARTIPLPPGIGSIDFPPLGRRKRRVRRKRRRRSAPLEIPTIPKSINNTKEMNTFIAFLATPNWELQAGVIRQLVAAKDKALVNILHKALGHKSLRVRLLIAQVLAKRGDLRALPLLYKESVRFFDQPGSLLMGGWLAYGAKAIPTLLAAVQKEAHPHLFLRALGLLRAKAALPLFARYAYHQNKSLRTIAREALQRYPTVQMTATLAQVFGATKTPQGKQNDRDRAALVRLLSYRGSAKGMALLIDRQKDRDSAVRFLARISLEDQANTLHKAMPTKLPKAPKGAAAWAAYWRSHKAIITAWYKAERARKQLTQVPTKNTSRVLLFYRTIHPVFGYGRMPLLVHDAAWKKPTPPQRGKLWHVPLPSAEFAALVKKVGQSGFFRWTPNMGRVRDITVIVGKKRRRVSIGMARHLDFEKLERRFLALAKRKKLGLNFADFYRRTDEASISKEGQIGQWAYRSTDRLPQKPWHKRSGWKPSADIEGIWAVLRDIVRYTPSRTRLIAVDFQATRVRISTLLFGSRAQSRLTREGIERSKRLHKFKLSGLGNIYLSADKIEQMIFDLKRMPFPWSSRSSPKTGKSISWPTLWRKVWPKASSRLLSLKFERGNPHRLFARWKTHSTHSLLQSLSQLAVHSTGDRLFGLRINASGRPDRATFKLIVQMQWEMRTPVAAKQLSGFLKHNPPSAHEPFTPVYR